MFALGKGLILCVLPWIGWVAVIIVADNRDRFAWFHSLPYLSNDGPALGCQAWKASPARRGHDGGPPIRRPPDGIPLRSPQVALQGGEARWQGRRSLYVSPRIWQYVSPRIFLLDLCSKMRHEYLDRRPPPTGHSPGVRETPPGLFFAITKSSGRFFCDRNMWWLQPDQILRHDGRRPASLITRLGRRHLEHSRENLRPWNGRNG